MILEKRRGQVVGFVQAKSRSIPVGARSGEDILCDAFIRSEASNFHTIVACLTKIRETATATKAYA